MASRSPPAHSDDSSEAARSRDDADGDALMPVRLRHSNEVAYAIIDGRVTQVQVATAADLAAAAAAADIEAEEAPAEVDDDDENDNDENSMEVTGLWWGLLEVGEGAPRVITH